MKRRILLTIITLSFLPMIVFIRIPTFEGLNFEDPETVKLVTQIYISLFGSVLGLVGAVILFWQYMLGVRFIFAKWIEDHIWLNKIHKLFGKYGVLLIFAHPVFVAIGYGVQANEWLFSLSAATEFELGVLFGKVAISILGFIWITSALFRSRLSFRLWKLLHFLAYLILPIIFLHGPKIGQILTSTTVLNMYFTALIVLYFIVTALRILNLIGFAKKKFLLVSKEEITHDVVKYNFKPMNRPIIPKIGQYVYVQKRIFGEEHPFTISHFDKSNNVLSLTIKKSGKFSREISDLQNGEVVFLDGPYGIFTREVFESDKSKVFIAGGIGITPFIRVFQNLHSVKGDIRLFYGNKTPKDVAYEPFVNQAMGTYCTHVISGQFEPSEMVCEKGFINTQVLKKYLEKDLSQYEYYICGPMLMMENLEEALEDEGVNRKDIYMEKFSL